MFPLCCLSLPISLIPTLDINVFFPVLCGSLARSVIPSCLKWMGGLLTGDFLLSLSTVRLTLSPNPVHLSAYIFVSFFSFIPKYCLSLFFVSSLIRYFISAYL
ncbi:rCG34463 [Rattus norvegicus]|uniref:RCG34463 n=1 Tax=Rattus norvegicus TaxID=10116 RepID=A6HDN9_RAT|nr:rCG34463 [Rattus norvegicus]